MSKVQLIYTGVSQIVGGPELGLLILSDLSHIRQIAIVCDSRMEYELSLRAAGTSLTERLLPEVLCSINPRMTGEHYEVLFNSIIDGQYKALLVDKDDLTPPSVLPMPFCWHRLRSWTSSWRRVFSSGRVWIIMRTRTR